MRTYSIKDTARGAALAVVAAAFAAGCGAPPGPGEPGWTPRTTVTVQNHNWQDANIYLLEPGPRMRLGTVMSMSVERFRIPARAQEGPVRLGVDLIGNNEYEVTGRIVVQPGADVRWSLANQLSLSSYTVR